MTRVLLFAYLALFLSCSSDAQEIPEYKVKKEELVSLNKLITVSHMAGKMWGGFSGNMLIPEESYASLTLAHRAGFKYAEIDVRLTQDGKFICMHDGSINRTMINSDGTPIVGSILIKNKSLQELKDGYKYKSTDESYQTKIFTLEEFLTLCSDYDMIPFFHKGDLSNQSIDAFMDIVNKSAHDNFVFMSDNIELLKRVRSLNVKSILLFQDNDNFDVNYILRSLIPIKRPCGFSSLLLDKITPELCQTMKEYGYYIQASIPYKEAEAMKMINNGVNMLLTGGCLNNNPKGVLVNEYSSQNGFNNLKHSGKITSKGLVLQDGDYVVFPIDAVYLGAADLTIKMSGKIKMELLYVFSGILETKENKQLRLKYVTHNNKEIRIESIGETIIDNFDLKQYKL